MSTRIRPRPIRRKFFLLTGNGTQIGQEYMHKEAAIEHARWRRDSGTSQRATGTPRLIFVCEHLAGSEFRVVWDPTKDDLR